MIINPYILRPTAATPFSEINTITLATSNNYVPSCLTWSPEAGNNWIVGRKYSTSAMVSYSTNGGTTFTSRSFSGSNVRNLCGIGYTTNGYFVLCGTTAQYAVGYGAATLSATSAISVTRYATAANYYMADLIVSGNAVSVIGRYSTTASVVAYSTANTPSFALTSTDTALSTNTSLGRICNANGKPVLLTTNGKLGYQASVGASSIASTKYNVAGDTAITASRVCYGNGYIVVAGTKTNEDGIYIWYSNGSLGSTMTWTEKKISSLAGTVFGIGYANNTFVIAYYIQSLKDIAFTQTPLLAICKDTPNNQTYCDCPIPNLNHTNYVDLKGNGTSEFALISYQSTNSYITRLIL